MTNLFNVFLKTSSLQVIGKVIIAVTGVFLARILGPVEYGEYSFLLSIITLCSIPIVEGLSNYIVREVSFRDKNYIYNLRRWAFKYIIIYSSFSCLICFFVFLNYDFESVFILYFILFLIPIRGGVNIYCSILNGWKKIIESILPNKLIYPGLILILYVIFYYFSDLGIDKVLFCQLISGCLIFILLHLKVEKCFSKEDTVIMNKNSFNIKIASISPFIMIGVATAANSEISKIILGLTGDVESISFLKVAIQMMSIISVFLVSIKTIVAPKVSSSYHNKNISELKSIAKNAVKISFYSALPIILIFLIFGKGIIIFTFGKEYLPAYYVLVILCMGELFNIATGSVGMFLNMSGYERLVLLTQVISMMISFCLMLILIPIYQEIGAAISICVGTFIWNSILVYQVYKKLGIKTYIRL